MASSNSSIIPPFPTTIDRRDFGNFVSGFTAGEGCFMLWVKNREHPDGRAKFCIRLRLDDRDVLRLTQSFFQCGTITTGKPRGRKPILSSKPYVGFNVDRTSHLHDIIVPHFDKHPMYAKKQRDFLVWKEAVKFMHERSQSKRIHGRGCPRPSWTTRELEIFQEFIVYLKETRVYQGPESIPKQIPPIPETNGVEKQEFLF